MTSVDGQKHAQKIKHICICFTLVIAVFQLLQTSKFAADHLQRSLVKVWKGYYICRVLILVSKTENYAESLQRENAQNQLTKDQSLIYLICQRKQLFIYYKSIKIYVNGLIYILNLNSKIVIKLCNTEQTFCLVIYKTKEIY